MTKTLDDYKNDPDIAKMREPYREIHAIRLMLRDETAHMTTAERVEHINRKADAILAPMGKTLCYDLMGKDSQIIDDTMPEYKNSPSSVAIAI